MLVPLTKKGNSGETLAGVQGDGQPGGACASWMEGREGKSRGTNTTGQSGGKGKF